MKRPNGRCRRLEELIEDACGESPAASLDRVCSLLFYIIARSVFVSVRSVFVHYADCCILERRYGFVGRFLGLLGGVGGILGGLGSPLPSTAGLGPIDRANPLNLPFALVLERRVCAISWKMPRLSRPC